MNFASYNFGRVQAIAGDYSIFLKDLFIKLLKHFKPHSIYDI